MRGSTHIWEALDLGFDETKQMLLVHGGTVVNVGVYLSDVIEVTVFDKDMSRLEPIAGGQQGN